MIAGQTIEQQAGTPSTLRDLVDRRAADDAGGRYLDEDRQPVECLWERGRSRGLDHERHAGGARRTRTWLGKDGRTDPEQRHAQDSGQVAGHVERDRHHGV